MSEDFRDDIKNWVLIDNEIRKSLDEIKELREEKSRLNDNIISYVEDNNLNSAIVQISDSKIKFQTTNSTAPLTFRFLESCLNEILRESEDVPKIIQYIKDKREVKSNMDIKRVYSNK
tara:strand:+ start:187 stop:540 length:354 start_codon:yes stop_codon:yes gene_type:complete